MCAAAPSMRAGHGVTPSLAKAHLRDRRGSREDSVDLMGLVDPRMQIGGHAGGMSLFRDVCGCVVETGSNTDFHLVQVLRVICYH